MSVQKMVDFYENLEKQYIDGRWVDVPKGRLCNHPKPLAWNQATTKPSREQRNTNNGMTIKKMSILVRRCEAEQEKAKHGVISWTACHRNCIPWHRDIEILAGREVAHLQG